MAFNSGTIASGNREEPYRSIMELAPLLYFRLNDTGSTAVNLGSVTGNGTYGAGAVVNDPPVPTRSVAKATTFTGFSNSNMTRTDGVLTGSSPTFSAGFWMITNTVTATVTYFSMKDTTNNGSGLLFRGQNSGVTMTVSGTTTAGATDFSISANIGGGSTNYSDDGTTVTAPKILIDGNAHLIGVTVTATTASLYVDGEFIQSAARAGGTWSDTGDTWVGANYVPTESFWGRMSDVFVTATQMTDTQWRAMWRNSMVNVPSPLINDNWNDAVTIPLNGSGTMNLKDSRREPGEPLGTRGDMFSGFVKFIPPVSGSYDIIASAVKGGTPMKPEHFYLIDPVATGSDLASLSQIFPTYTGLDFRRYDLTGGTTYTIAYTTDLKRREYSDELTITVKNAQAAPFNDNFANALTINVSSAGTYTGSNYASTDESGEAGITGAGTWFKFVAPATGTITFDTQLSSTTLTLLYVMTGASVSTTTTIGSDTAGSGINFTAVVTVSVTSGTTYYVKVGDFNHGVASYILRWTTVT